MGGAQGGRRRVGGCGRGHGHAGPCRLGRAYGQEVRADLSDHSRRPECRLGISTDALGSGGLGLSGRRCCCQATLPFREGNSGQQVPLSLSLGPVLTLGKLQASQGFAFVASPTACLRSQPGFLL